MTIEKLKAVQDAVAAYAATSASLDAANAFEAGAQSAQDMAQKYATVGVFVATQSLIDKADNALAVAKSNYQDAFAKASDATIADGAALAGVQAALLASKQTPVVESI